MQDPLEGINEKLKRSHESVGNLHADVSLFFQGGEHPIRGDEDFQATLAAVRYYHENPTMPLRFSVLVGEIIHHFRSCLDHIVWQLSDASSRSSHSSRIEFPVFSRKPADKNEAAGYNRKVAGIRSDEALGLIGDLQPSNRTNPLDDPIWIIHDMDRTDKHRELVIVAMGFHMSAPPRLEHLARHYATLDAGPIPLEVARQFQQYVKLSPDIAFRQFGEREHQPVVPSLLQLENTIREVVRLFEVELRKGWHRRTIMPA